MDTRPPTHDVAKLVAKQAPNSRGNNGARKFERKVFKPWWTRDGRRFEAETYAIRLSQSRRRETVNLLTADLREAAKRAARFAAVLRVSGWEAAHAELSPERARTIAAMNSPTVGAVVRAAERVAVHVRPLTLRQYQSSLRWIAALVVGIEGDSSRFDYKCGGAAAWREKVDSVPISALTPQKVESAIATYRMGRGASPEAARTAASFVRQARGLWSRKLLRLLPFENLPNPFSGIILDNARAPKYAPSFDSGKLVASARLEFRETDAEAWKAFLLLLGAGLRKGEADALLWSSLDTENGHVRITAGKTADSVGEVPIAPETAKEFARLRSTANGLFVLEGSAKSKALRQRTYRAARTFRRLSEWLRLHGVADRKPIHALRKEAGSLVNEIAGIHAASAFLRHGDIGVTAQYYADARRRVVVPIFDLNRPVDGGNQ